MSASGKFSFGVISRGSLFVVLCNIDIELQVNISILGQFSMFRFSNSGSSITFPMKLQNLLSFGRLMSSSWSRTGNRGPKCSSTFSSSKWSTSSNESQFLTSRIFNLFKHRRRLAGIAVVRFLKSSITSFTKLLKKLTGSAWACHISLKRGKFESSNFVISRTLSCTNQKKNSLHIYTHNCFLYYYSFPMSTKLMIT